MRHNEQRHTALSNQPKGDMLMNMQRRHLKTTGILSLTLAFALALTGMSSAAMVTASEDAFAEDDNAGGTIKVRPNGISGGSFNFSKKAWIKFDLTGQNADGSKSATFTLTFEGGGDNDSDIIAVWGLDAGFVPNETGEYTTAWTQSTFTSDGGASWQNAPENTNTGGATSSNGDGAFDTTQATKIDTFDLDPDDDGVANDVGESFSVVIATLNDFLQSDNTVTLMIAGVEQVGNAVDQEFFNSSDTGNEPTLEFAVIPEPSSFALLGLGGLTLLRRRR